eukprot:m.86500 g.86500  ORF g.86500 m.86500 type:complete len:815 (-) comp13059_c0_seq2:62-2506(-)
MQCNSTSLMMDKKAELQRNLEELLGVLYSCSVNTEIKCPHERCKHIASSKVDLGFHLRTEHKTLAKTHFPRATKDVWSGADKHGRLRYPYLFRSQIKNLCIHNAAIDEEDAVFYVPGLCAERSHGRVKSRGNRNRSQKKYPCPAAVCSSVFSSAEDLAYHQRVLTCTPEIDLTDMQKVWEKEDAIITAISQGLQCEPFEVQDREFFTKYKWPMVYGIWCMTEFQVRSLLSEDKDEILLYSELEYRYCCPEEENILKKMQITHASAPKRFRIFKADEVYEMLRRWYPLRYEWSMKLKQKNSTSNPRKQSIISEDKLEVEDVLSQKFETGSLELAQNIQNIAVKQAARYNQCLVYARRQDRTSFYEASTQVIHYPGSRRIKITPRFKKSQYPVATEEGQFQEFCLIANHETGDDQQVYEATKISPEKLRHQKRVRARRAQKSWQLPMRKAPLDAKCMVCMQANDPSGNSTELLACATCPRCAHASCLALAPELVETIRTYEWQCMECKRCTICNDPHDEAKMLFCDSCDRGYHTYCVGLAELPKGRWVCEQCEVCASCGTTSPGGENARWRHEYSQGSSQSKRKFLQTLCVKCSDLFRDGQYCPICLVVYKTDETDLPMVCCDKCDRWIHTDCDNIDEVTYGALSASGRSYVCSLCRGQQAEILEEVNRKRKTVTVPTSPVQAHTLSDEYYKGTLTYPQIAWPDPSEKRRKITPQDTFFQINPHQYTGTEEIPPGHELVSEMDPKRKHCQVCLRIQRIWNPDVQHDYLRRVRYCNMVRQGCKGCNMRMCTPCYESKWDHSRMLIKSMIPSVPKTFT